MLEKWNNLINGPVLSHDANAPGVGGAGGGLRVGADDEHVDEWHHHESSEGPAQEEHVGQINTALVIQWFVVIVVFVIASIIFIVVYFNHYNAKARAISIETTLSQDYLDSKAAAHKRLGLSADGPQWTGLAGGHVQVPVTDAMQSVLDQYKGGAMALPTMHGPAHASGGEGSKGHGH